MRPGTVKWHRGKHPLFECFTCFLADLEDLIGEENVMHGAFRSIKYHPPNPQYSFRYYDSEKHNIRILGKYDGKMQEFSVQVNDPDLIPLIKAFVENYPDPNYLAYVPGQPKIKEKSSVRIEDLVLDSE